MNAHVSIRQAELAEAFTRWIKRRTVPSHFAGDEQAEDDEFSSLMRTLSSNCPNTDVVNWVSKVSGLLESRATHRSWPNAGEVAAACREVNQRGASAQSQAVPAQQGDKTKLSYDQLSLLEQKILPTAREWLKIPGLEGHGRQTLAYWGEAAQ